MPYSYSKYKNEVKQHLIDTFNPSINILDAGAGSGAYSELLREYFPNIDGLEIYPNYASVFNLEQKYRNFYLGDILNFDITFYDYVILGDIIEHLEYNDAFNLLTNINKNKKCLVAVPYMFEQGEEYGNIYEIHKQPDLTDEIFLTRYPMMKLLYGDQHYGYYVNY